MLICGATGFIGRNLTEHFSQNGSFDVTAVYFQRPPYAQSNVKWVQADLRNPADVERVVKDADIVIQAAATTSGAKDIVSCPYIHVTDNAVLNSYLLRAAWEARIKHFIFFSCTVMYPSAGSPLKESDWHAGLPVHPRYFGVGNTKVYIEKMCEFFASISDTRFTVIRHSNIYGPHDKFDLERSHVFGATLSKVMTATDKIVVWGSGEEARDVLHVDDLVRFVELAIARQSASYKLFNCGWGRAVSVNEIVATMLRVAQKKMRIEHDLSKPSIKTSLCLDCSLAMSELGWEPAVSLENGIKKTIEWWRANINPVTLKPYASV